MFSLSISILFLIFFRIIPWLEGNRLVPTSPNPKVKYYQKLYRNPWISVKNAQFRKLVEIFKVHFHAVRVNAFHAGAA